MKKISLWVAAFSMIAICIVASASGNDIDVRLENIVSDNTINIDFGEVEPMKITDSTVVPLRRFCESAGLTVDWSDAHKAACVTLEANAQSHLPIEKYAYSILSQADTKGQALQPKSITVTVTVSNPKITLRYNYTDQQGSIVSLGKTVDTSVPATIVSQGLIVVPVRSLMEAFGLEVGWSNNTITISIPASSAPEENMNIVPVETFLSDGIKTDIWFGSIEEPVQAVALEPSSPIPENAVYLGNFKITHYCSCSKCCGVYGNATAWAGKLRPGTTIAVDPRVIPKLSNVYIDGYGYRRAEDCGGAIKGNKIDVAVSSHSEALKLGVRYKDVWLLK